MTRRLRYLFRRRSLKGFPNAELLSVYRDYGVVPKASRDDNFNRASENLDNYQLVRPGDLVVNKMKAWQGSVAVSNFEGIVSPAYFVFESTNQEYGRFLHYLLRSKPLIAKYASISKGIRPAQWDLDIDQFKDLTVDIPPIDAQVMIADFLDRENTKADALISKYARLIELLDEMQTALITQCVTKGIDSAARMQDTGINWLGAVPAHWRVRPLKRFWTVTDCKHVTVDFVDTGIPLASVREAQRFDLDLTNANQTTPEWYATLIEGGRKPKRGDLIYCRNVSVGAATYVGTDEIFAMGQDVCLIHSDVDARYLNYFLRSSAMHEQMTTMSIGVTFDRINVADIRRLIITWPPVQEQAEIVEYLDRRVAKMITLKAQLERALNLVAEHRSALIAAAVGGQIDVQQYRSGQCLSQKVTA